MFSTRTHTVCEQCIYFAISKIVSDAYKLLLCVEKSCDIHWFTSIPQVLLFTIGITKTILLFLRERGGEKKKTGLRDLHSKVIKSQCDVSFLSFRPRYINLRYMITTIWCTYSILYIPYNSTLHLWDWFDGVNAMDALNRSFNYCRFYESSTLSKITLR